MIGHLKSNLQTPHQVGSDPYKRQGNNGNGTASLNALVNRGRWNFSLFLVVSGAAFFARDFNLFAVIPENARQLLGNPPPPELISIALGIYALSAIILLLSSLANNSQPPSNWTHLGYRAAFYFFYLVSNSLADHFLAVFYVGLLLYGLENLCIWIYTTRSSEGNQKAMNRL